MLPNESNFSRKKAIIKASSNIALFHYQKETYNFTRTKAQ
jgi:hypothetical protein